MDIDLAALIASRKRGHALPAPFYLDPELFARDLELIFGRHEGIDRCGLGLKPVRLETLAGLLFICLSPDPPADFDELRRALTPYIAPHDIANCKVALQTDLIEAGNWKLTMENNRECNHYQANHPELTVPLLEYGFGYQPSPENRAQLQEFTQLLAREHARWQACGLPSSAHTRASAMPPTNPDPTRPSRRAWSTGSASGTRHASPPASRRCRHGARRSGLHHAPRRA